MASGINGTMVQTVPEIAEKTLAATVYLEMKDNNGKTIGFGSGFFVEPNLIATNYHVIAGADSGTAKLVDESTTYKIEGWTATDKANDLALLEVSASGIKPLMLGDSGAIRIGDPVYVAGNPKGLKGTFSDGIISSLRDSDTKERFQMTAPISPGSSGGPVLNSKGQVIGVSASAHRDPDAQNLNFAIPSRYLKDLLRVSKPPKPLSQGNQTISAETYFRRGYAYYDLELFDLAIPYYDKAIQLKPDYAEAYFNRGVAKRILDQYTAAISDFDKAIQLEPNYAEAYFNRGFTKAVLGQYTAAISDYDKATQYKPDYAIAYHNRGLAKYNLGQYVEVISDYDKAIQHKPGYTKAYYNRGLAKYNLGQYVEAISDYDKAIQHKPDYTKAYMARGLAKYNLRQYTAAISDYDKAIQHKPDYAYAYYNRGQAKALLNRPWEAKQDYQTALRLAVQAGDMETKALAEKALQVSDYDQAIQHKPDHARAYYNRGNAKANLGQYFAAMRDYDQAAQHKPDYARAYYNRGIVKALLNRKWEAEQDYRTALKLAVQVGDMETKAKAEKALRQLG